MVLKRVRYHKSPQSDDWPGSFFGRLCNLLILIGLQAAFLLPLAKLSEPFKIPIWNLEKYLISRR